MIQVKNLTKTFGSYKALDDASLHVKKGSLYGLVGPNGAGKSTIIRHITGIYRPDQGQVFVDGEQVFENPTTKERIAYIPDDLFYFSQANTMEMMRFFRGMYPKFDSIRFEKLREAFSTIDVKRNIRRLSKGMQKQVAFWLAICCNPDILILDEPVDGLDPVMRRQVWSILLNDVAESETTVLVSSHNLRELEDVCDHVGIMHQGKIMLERSLSDLQGNVSKIQIVFEDGLPELPKTLSVLHSSNTGRIYTLIIKGNPDAIEQQLITLNPILLDVLPLTLEEIFIYEMGGANYGVKDILL